MLSVVMLQICSVVTLCVRPRVRVAMLQIFLGVKKTYATNIYTLKRKGGAKPPQTFLVIYFDFPINHYPFVMLALTALYACALRPKPVFVGFVAPIVFHIIIGVSTH